MNKNKLMKWDEMPLLSNHQHLEYFCILFPKVCQSLISGIQTVVRGPVGAVMNDAQSEFKRAA